MSIVLDTNMRLFADRMNITSSRMIQDYGQKTIDEIIEAEAAQGNTKAINYARELYGSPDKLISLYKLANVENRYTIINNMDEKTREMILPMLDNNDLVMGLYFFRQEKVLKMLLDVSGEELVNVILATFPPEKIVMMYSEEDLAMFFQRDELEKHDVIEQLKKMPPEVMFKFIEGVTGRPSEETNPMDLINSIEALPTDKYRDFMSSIDPDVQRQLVFQLTEDKPEYFLLFENEAYVNMLATLNKQDMIKPLVLLEQESLINMVTELPPDFMSIVAAQINTRDFAEFLIDGNLELLEKTIMM